MAEAGDTSSRCLSPTWDARMCDLISVLVHLKAEAGVEVLMCNDEEKLRLPRRKIGLGKDSAGSSLNLVWQKDVPLNWQARSVAGEATGFPLPDQVTPQLLQITRVFDPLEARHYHHYVFGLSLEKDLWVKVAERNGYCKVTLAKLRKSCVERKEVLSLAECLTGQLTGTHMREVSPNQLWQPLDPDRQDQMSAEDELLRSPGFREQDVELIYSAFVRCSYPHATVLFEDVKKLFSDLGWKNREKDIFRALDRKQMGELSLEDFVYGLTAMDPMTPHGKSPGELRSRYIFRFYNRKDDDLMEEEDIQRVVKDILMLQGHDCSEAAIQERTKAAHQAFTKSRSKKVYLEDFLAAIGTLQFRGTSMLFRATVAIIPHLVCKYGLVSAHRKSLVRDPSRSVSSRMANKRKRTDATLTSHKTGVPNHSQEDGKPVPMETNDQEMAHHSLSSGSAASMPLSDGAFQSQEIKRYTLAQHTVKVRRSGQIIDTQLLLDMERAGEVSDTGFDVEESSEGSSTAVDRASLLMATKRPSRQFDRYHSVDAFNTRSLPNEMVSALRFFEHGKKDKPQLNWGEVDIAKLGQYIISLCAAIKGVLESEPRMLVLNSPCYILGDLHGNYRDLICFEKALWRIGPHLTPSNFLFLGDYVDRGDYGIEVVSYLFAQKLQAPTKFFLLRGNHEVRDIQKMFTFYSECLQKFGEGLGQKVWEAVNDAFDYMPVAAVIDDQIFCIHGGIPNIDGNLSEIDKIPCPLPNPEVESAVAWQIMWNDPLVPDDLNDEVIHQLSKNQGFAYNAKRNTACVFNQTAFANFLQRNGLTHVVRAHEVKQSGFEIQQSGRLMTVFSSSHYCGGSNEAACILLDNRRIRAIRIDTT